MVVKIKRYETKLNRAFGVSDSRLYEIYENVVRAYNETDSDNVLEMMDKILRNVKSDEEALISMYILGFVVGKSMVYNDMLNLMAQIKTAIENFKYGNG